MKLNIKLLPKDLKLFITKRKLPYLFFNSTSSFIFLVQEFQLEKSNLIEVKIEKTHQTFNEIDLKEGSN